MLASYRTERRLKRLVTYLVLLAFVLITVFPLYWNILTSLRMPRDVYAQQDRLVPRNLTLDNYERLLTRTQMPRWIQTTVIITLVTTFISMVIATLAAYALARLKFRGAQTLGKSVLFMYLLPQTLLYIPLFVMLNDLKARFGVEVLNTLNALYLSYPTFLLPFCTWLLLGYFRSLPIELEDAALMDGCGRMGVLTRIVLPLSMPGIITAVVFSVTNAWNEFLYALVFIQTDKLWTVQVGLRSFQLADTMLWGLTMSAAVLTSLPPIILYMLLQRFVVGGLVAGAVKG